MEVAKRFMDLFSGLARAHGTYAVLGKDSRKGKMTGKAKTLKEPVTERKWRDHLEGKVGIGIVPIRDDNSCVFGAIDVDQYSLDLEDLEKRIREKKLPLVVCRTKSGGAHLYVFLTSPAPAEEVRNRLMEMAVMTGYPTSEIFPKQSELAGDDDVGNWINMPYFEGDRSTRYMIHEGRSIKDPEEFLSIAERRKIDLDSLSRIQVDEDPKLKDGPPCLQHLAISGFPEGTRNRALFNLGVFAKLRYGDGWEKYLEEMNRTYLSPPLESREVRGIIGSLRKKEYSYTCKEQPIVSACSRSICVRRDFGIKGASDNPGVLIDGLVKVHTFPPTWILSVDGKRIRMESTDSLLNQGQFLRMCVEELNLLPKRISHNAWDDVVRRLLDKVEEVEAPEDAGLVGQFRYLLDIFCLEQAPARHKDEILLGRPMLEDDGYIYFRSPDLLAYMEKHRMRITAKDAWNQLRELKATVKQYKIKGRCVRCWGVPAPERQTEPFDVPDVTPEEEF